MHERQGCVKRFPARRGAHGRGESDQKGSYAKRPPIEWRGGLVFAAGRPEKGSAADGPFSAAVTDSADSTPAGAASDPDAPRRGARGGAVRPRPQEEDAARRLVEAEAELLDPGEGRRVAGDSVALADVRQSRSWHGGWRAAARPAAARSPVRPATGSNPSASSSPRTAGRSRTLGSTSPSARTARLPIFPGNARRLDGGRGDQSMMRDLALHLFAPQRSLTSF